MSYYKQEVNFGVNIISASTVLESNNEVHYLNIETKEGDTYCVKLTRQGFQVGLRRS